MLRYLLTATCLLTSLQALAPQPATAYSPAVKAFKAGVEFHNRSDYAAAAKAYREALRLDAELVSAAINLAIIHEKWRENETAHKLYNDAVRVAPRSFAARYNRGQFLQKRGQLEAALEDYRVALRISPSETSLYVNVAAIEIRLFETKKDVSLLKSAEQNLLSAERLRSKSPALYFNKARLNELMNHPARARTMYEEAMRHYAPQSAEYKTCAMRADRLSRQLSHN